MAQQRLRTVKLHKKTSLLLAGVTVILICGCSAWLVLKARLDPDTPFLRTSPQADWILYYLSPETVFRTDNFVNLVTEFSKDFQPAPGATGARLYIKAFKTYRLWINGNELPVNTTKNWKRTQVIDISKFLKAGTNKLKVKVGCKYGPPALWLYSKGLPEEIKTDTSWEASILASPPVPARLANDCFVHPISYEWAKPAHILVKKLPMLILFFIISSTIFCLGIYKQKNSRLKSLLVLRALTFSPRGVLIISVVLWIILFINNAPKIPLTTGFDAPSHLYYVEYLSRLHRLPAANQGWETYQPPLFYGASAVILGLARVIFSEQAAYFWLKLIPFLSGVGQIFLVYFAAGMLFPDSKTKQALSVAISALIPMNIYISHYISNESLCALLMALSILLTIKILDRSRNSLLLFAILGTVLGLALLTKFTALTILPVIYLLLLYKLIFEQRNCSVVLVKYLGVMTICILIAAGWFYLRNWIHFGKPLVGNWDSSIGFAWWQDPGFHTYKYFCQFGRVFVLPYFAGFYSLLDSLYSTFWGDAFLGGAGDYEYCPPWNYEYTSAVYLLAIPFTAAIIIGIVRAVLRSILRADKFCLLILGAAFAIFFSLVAVNLQIPCYAQAKAFYGLAAVLPLSLIFALGFDIVDERLKNKGLFLVRAAVYGWFGTLALAIFFCFLVRPGQMEKKINLLELHQQGKISQVISYYNETIGQRPDGHNAHYQLATAYFLKGEYSIAAKHYKKALQLRPDWPDTLNNLALSLLNKPHTTGSDTIQALRYAKRACELTGYLRPQLLRTLSFAYAATKQSEKAVATAQRAIEFATSMGQKDLAQTIRRWLDRYEK